MWAGVLSLPGVLGVVMLDLLVDCGVLCLPVLPGVLCVFARVDIKSLFTPLCLDVLLQAWQVAIWDKERKMFINISWSISIFISYIIMFWVKSIQGIPTGKLPKNTCRFCKISLKLVFHNTKMSTSKCKSQRGGESFVIVVTVFTQTKVFFLWDTQEFDVT